MPSKPYLSRKNAVITLLSMVAIAAIGFYLLKRLSEYDGLAALLVIWSILYGGGALITVVALLALAYLALRDGAIPTQTNAFWQQVLLFGLWVLLIGIGSCGLLIGFSLASL